MKTSDVIEHFAAGDSLAEGIKRLSAALGISREAIYQWPERVPHLRAFQIESVTGGALKVQEDTKCHP